MTREINILRIKRTWNGPDVRGCKPITVYFEKWQDKDDIMRKIKFLKGKSAGNLGQLFFFISF